MSPRGAVASAPTSVIAGRSCERAVAALGPAVRAVSAIYRTPPWAAWRRTTIYNVVLIADDGAATTAAMAGAVPAARAGGRPGARPVRWGPRTLDADVITVDVHGAPGAVATIPS